MEEKENLIVAPYIRVSTDRQAKDGDSLDEQESELKKFCDYRGFKIHKLYIERGKSGGNTNRPEYQALIKAVRDGKIQAVVVKKIDRLSRSLLDFEDFMKLLQEKNIEFISIKENFDTTTALGKAMLRVALVFAQLEREQTSERLIDVFNYRASQGLYNGGVRPFGYTNVNKELVPYPKEKIIIEQIFHKFCDLKSTTQVAKFLNETGYRNRQNKLWDKREVFKILHRPIYKGFVSWNDKLYQGIHQPIISEKIFDQVQLVFQDKIKYQADTKTNALLQRLIFCGCCNSIMTPSHSLNRHKQKYFYYRCTSTQNAEKATSKCEFKYVPMAQLDQFLLEFLLSLSNESYWTPIELKILKHNQQIEIKAQAIKEEIRIIESKLQAIKDKKDQYLDTLILKSFNQSERQLINKRIEDMELEDKQLKGGLYKQEFELTKLEEEKVNIIEFKKIFVMFKADYEILSAYQKKEFILNHIKSIIYFPDRVSINLKLLPWPLDHYFKEARI